MLPAMLRLFAGLLPFVPGAIAVIAGVVAIRSLRREPVRSRPDRPWGIGVAALALGVLATMLIASLHGFDTGPRPEYLGPAMAYGVVVAGMALMAALAGYVVFSRFATRGAAMGSVIAPAGLIALSLGVANLAQAISNVAYNSQAASDAAALDQRSAGVTLVVGDVAATLTEDGTAIASVRLRATIHSDRDIVLTGGSKVDNPRFQFVVAEWFWSMSSPPCSAIWPSANAPRIVQHRPPGRFDAS